MTELSLTEAIVHAEMLANCLTGSCAHQHQQLAMWLRELKERRTVEVTQQPVAFMNRFSGMVFNKHQQPNAIAEPEIYIPLYIKDRYL
ncbi:hypothetical protein I6G97_09680 [Edwardsiella hoshinae]|uniref:Uncharacterized protein n=1 Tax=Edwardsiella hoshinae TaxID=93378 RepID=A0A376DHD5_9GAMM|nr:hypothetical protein [Edwardsiella hoshinae]QPR26757.1 hypothetical protein I6G97_09680 [Edwardsiella hoshinae]STC89492.1 Uncharacterised protein [Edwardsiella hoshinae]